MESLAVDRENREEEGGEIEGDEWRGGNRRVGERDGPESCAVSSLSKLDFCIN